MPYSPRPRCRQCNSRLAAPGKSLCVDCRRMYYGPQYRAMRRAILQEWVAANGWSCPGWGVQPHLVLLGDLQVDHIIPVNHGGLSEPGNLAVLCRQCNIRKGDRRTPPPLSHSKPRSGPGGGITRFGTRNAVLGRGRRPPAKRVVAR